MKRWVSLLLAHLFGISLLLAVFCLVIESVSFDAEYQLSKLDKEYIKSEIAVDDSEIDSIARTIIQYLKGDTDNIQRVLSDGSELYNERELLHMDDVVNLFRLCELAKFACIGACMLLFIVLFALNGFYCFSIIGEGCVKVLISMFGLVVIAGLWYMIDFDSFWTAFHKIAFTNDLWLMMPDDALIIFYTAEFFTAIVKRIIERLAVAMGAIFVIALVMWGLLPKEKGKKFGKKNFSH